MRDAILHLDFETRSVVDLKKFGLDVYAHHPSTDAWCMAYAFDDEPVQIWINEFNGNPLPKRITDHVKKGLCVTGHNVNFEWHIWNFAMKPRYGWPTLKLSQLDCTMARAYAMALPGSLDKLTLALNVSTKKDMKGHAVMRKLMKPRKIEDDGTIVWWDDQEKFDQLFTYCKKDVEAERECDALLLPLSEDEHRVWQLDLRINQRGVGIDTAAIKKTQILIDRVRKVQDAEMKRVTGGDIQRVNQATALLRWCQAYGIEIESLKKTEMKKWLDETDLPFEVREALELRSNSAKASVSKLETALDMSMVDGKVRNMFQYHGASTGRFAGRGLQLHNFARPEEQWEDPKLQDRIITNITRGVIDEQFIEEWHGPFMRVISSCLRGYLVADPGYEFIGADLKSIEGVTLPWLAGEEWKLEAFREHFWSDGPGIYQLAAAKIFNKTLDEVKKGTPFYLLGKVGELSMGYQGGKGAFKQMAVNYGVEVEDEKGEEIKIGWREAHPNIVKYWFNVEGAAIEAVRNPGGKYYAGADGRRVCFRVVGSYLWCRLPSGRCLCYPEPRLEMVDTFWGSRKEAVTFMTMDNRVGSKTKGKYVRMSSYGGKFVENITQAVARDVLVDAWPRLESAGYPIVLHVHDENMSMVKEGFGSVDEYEELMSIVPPWAKDLPIAADGFRGKRYRK